MFRVLFLIFIVMNLIVFAQTAEKPNLNETPKASKFDDFVSVQTGELRTRMDNFLVALHNNPTISGYIVNYGSNREVAGREKLFRNHLTFRKFPALRVMFVK